MSGKLAIQNALTPEQVRIIQEKVKEIVTQHGWGEVRIVIADGRPTRVVSGGSEWLDHRRRRLGRP